VFESALLGVPKRVELEIWFVVLVSDFSEFLFIVLGHLRVLSQVRFVRDGLVFWVRGSFSPEEVLEMGSFLLFSPREEKLSQKGILRR
jgi:hypothetical protein